MTADTSAPAASPDEQLTRTPALPRHDAMTLVIPLKAKEG
jgi:hypothetical protein